MKNWKGRSTSYPSLGDLLAKYPPEWNETEQAYRITFAADDGRHEVWYEDTRSLAPKFELATKEKLHSISAWVIGQEDPTMWDTLARDYRIAHPRSPLAEGSADVHAKRAARIMSGR